MSGSSDARERAMALLYEASIRGLGIDDVLAGLAVDPVPLAVELATGVAEHHDDLDPVIAESSVNWPLDRMPTMDRTILRLAAYELAHRPDVPMPVIIDEAVELAKRFSTDDSGRFVNGVLSRVAERLRPES
ncbi:MAG: transcription antitermination factor NusB [Actinomycetota bacterium]